MKNASLHCFAAFMLLAAGCAMGDPAGFLGPYVGGSFGEASSQISTPSYPGVQHSSVNGHLPGWSAFIGVRPLSFLGAELTYLDFGHQLRTWSAGDRFFTSIATANVHTRAGSLSALLFAPLPSRHIDLYGRAGLARQESRTHGSFNFRCTAPALCPLFVESPQSDYEYFTRFTYGAGVQLKLAPIMIRLDYQRIGTGAGDPYLASLGLAWRF